MSVAHYDLRFAKPSTGPCWPGSVPSSAMWYGRDSSLRGGVGEAITAFSMPPRLQVAGTLAGHRRREWVEHGTPAQLYALCGYDEEGILRALLAAGK